jgi:hypothetical protein
MNHAYPVSSVLGSGRAEAQRRRIGFPICAALALLSLVSTASAGKAATSKPAVPAVSAPQPIAFADQQPGGLLRQRLEKHFGRMEEEKYQPENFFLTVPRNKWQWQWAGDMEGRSILALVLEAQATGRSPKYLGTILARFPEHLNSRGYFGEIHPAGIAAEEQLSGNSWTLRALCEAYLWKQDQATLELARRLVKELFLPLSGYYYPGYPIRPEDRAHDGGVQGEQRKVLNYISSSDILSSFIPIDGMTQFYSLEPSPELKKVIDEAVARFLEVDLQRLKAQTHASLSSMRGVLRWYSLTGDRELLDAIVERFSLYENCAMSENYENWNWFGRPESTEPCAIIDSIMVAMDLWRYTGQAKWLEDAHRIAINALGATQRANGGFGCDTCPGGKGSPWLSVHTPEAHWCCTMRGGEGLSRRAQYAWFLEHDTATLAFPGANRAVLRLGEGPLTVVQQSGFPESFGSRLNIEAANVSKPVTLRLFAPSFTSQHNLTVNGKSVSAKVENGFISVKRTWKPGDSVLWDYQPVTRWSEPRNKNTPAGWRTLQHGPLILCALGDGKTPLALPANARRSWRVRPTIHSCVGRSSSQPSITGWIRAGSIRRQTARRGRCCSDRLPRAAPGRSAPAI